MSYSLHKESLLRATQKRQINCQKSNSLEIVCEENFTRAEQFIMISKWLESSVDIVTWFSEKSNKLSDNEIKTLAHKISIGLNLNCAGIIRQMIIFVESFYSSKLSNQLNQKTLTLVLSILIWIVLMCTPIELLHFTYHLYNISKNKALSFSEFEELLTDLFLLDRAPESYRLNFQVNQGNKEIQINEICEDVIEYLQLQHNNNNNNNINNTLSDQSESTIPLAVFYKYFAVKKRGYLYKFYSLQIQLLESIQLCNLYSQLFPCTTSNTTEIPSTPFTSLFETETAVTSPPPTSSNRLYELVTKYSEELHHYLVLKYGDCSKPALSHSQSLQQLSMSPIWAHTQRFFQQFFPEKTSPTSVSASMSPPLPSFSNNSNKSNSNGDGRSVKKAFISSASAVPASFYDTMDIVPLPPPVTTASATVPIPIMTSKSRTKPNTTVKVISDITGTTAGITSTPPWLKNSAIPSPPIDTTGNTHSSDSNCDGSKIVLENLPLSLISMNTSTTTTGTTKTNYMRTNTVDQLHINPRIINQNYEFNYGFNIRSDFIDNNNNDIIKQCPKNLSTKNHINNKNYNSFTRALLSPLDLAGMDVHYQPTISTSKNSCSTGNAARESYSPLLFISNMESTSIATANTNTGNTSTTSTNNATTNTRHHVHVPLTNTMTTTTASSTITIKKVNNSNNISPP